MSAAEAFYLYCCARSEPLPEKIEGEGIDAARPLVQRRDEDLAAVLSEVPLEDFTGPGSEARLKDLGWLAPRALRHEQVIEGVSRRSPVLPARFGTLFSSVESVDRLLREHHGAIREFLDHVAGTEEWGVKGFLDRGKALERVVDEELAAQRAELAASPGLRYMQERRARAQAEDKLRRWLAQTLARAREDLSHHAAQSAERRPISSGPPGAAAEMVVNWAFLVHKAALDEFRSAVGRLSRELADWGLAFECAGPFPPYSFTPALLERAR